MLGNLFLLSGNQSGLKAQIYEPEGLNLPGTWNSWQNPPANNLALASSTQVIGGRVSKITTGTVRWQTWFSVAASGADLVGGDHTWLFTSGPSGSPWSNKWAGVNVTMNTLQNYTFNNGADNSISLTNGKYYTVNWRDNGYAGTQAIFMETSSLPVNLTNVSVPSNVLAGQQASVNLTVDATPSPEENFYLRYTTNAWNSSSTVSFTMSGLGGTATIPAQSAGAVVEYYVFSSTVTGISSDYDMQTIRLNKNGGSNYSYTVIGLSTQAEILSFSLPEQTGPATINSAAATVSIEVAHGTDVTSLTPTITVSAGATISPASGLAQNFSSPVVYTVTAQDGNTTKNWTVTVSVAAPPPPNYGLRDDGGVNLPTLTYWY
ncbi:MAG: DUF5018 domain-containing protein, partial [Bacteroidia bacterium]|nr:DUF5018 domain-containing protein [Bacteroidia bacterium]